MTGPAQPPAWHCSPRPAAAAWAAWHTHIGAPRRERGWGARGHNVEGQGGGRRYEQQRYAGLAAQRRCLSWQRQGRVGGGPKAGQGRAEWGKAWAGQGSLAWYGLPATGLRCAVLLHLAPQSRTVGPDRSRQGPSINSPTRPLSPASLSVITTGTAPLDKPPPQAACSTPPGPRPGLLHLTRPPPAWLASPPHLLAQITQHAVCAAKPAEHHCRQSKGRGQDEGGMMRRIRGRGWGARRRQLHKGRRRTGSSWQMVRPGTG